jgi:hypothetical protein
MSETSTVHGTADGSGVRLPSAPPSPAPGQVWRTGETDVRIVSRRVDGNYDAIIVNTGVPWELSPGYLAAHFTFDPATTEAARREAAGIPEAARAALGPTAAEVRESLYGERAAPPRQVVGYALADSTPDPDHPGHHLVEMRLASAPPDYEPIPYVSVGYAAGPVVDTAGITRAPWTLDVGPVIPARVRALRPDPSSSCARCGGPVLLVCCAREGGCRTADERVADEEARVGPCVIARVAQRGVFAGEPYWQALVGGESTYHPTRAMAVLAWREAAMAVERGR